MQQTILALAAILIFSLYTLSRHESDAGLERISITAEYETAAAGLARARLHEIQRRAFDEADVGRDGMRSSTQGLTPSNQLGREAGETNESSYDDLDDFNGIARPVSAERNGETLSFRDSVSVRYLDPSDPTASPNRSLAKEITVIVTAVPSGYIGKAPVMARLRRVVTPASGAAHTTN
ncbi:hypothetical protein [Rubricoccus marinus]|uniref:Uncharacterized protein n=1 Tax=Rubricoccus marinus TaxID=716817 RepID=A0A259TYW1_9BACT|nr:hypothetical protein [Rubricoccus marinus]OZC02876.1 hypothetical protein BSZ36_07765 [Rubricoccus marinus]